MTGPIKEPGVTQLAKAAGSMKNGSLHEAFSNLRKTGLRSAEAVEALGLYQQPSIAWQAPRRELTPVEKASKRRKRQASRAARRALRKA